MMSNLSTRYFTRPSYIKSGFIKLGFTNNKGMTHITRMSAIAFGLMLTACSTLPTSSPHSNNSLQTPQAPTVALVLGGGGAKGFAHVGVIKALEQNNIQPDLIVGSSVGSLVGSLYASGQSASELETLALTTKDSELTDFTVAYQGIIEGLKLRNFVNTHVDDQPIEAFPTRFAVVATEKHTAKKTVFTTGEAGLIVQASSSVPNVFIAPRIPEKVGKKYVDGGVSSMVPVDTARQLGADVVIAVDLQAGVSPPTTSKPTQHKPMTLQQMLSKKDMKGGIWALIEEGYAQFGNTPQKITNDANEVTRADVIIRPNLNDISSIDTTQRSKAIEAGRIATEQNLANINEAIAKAEQNYKVEINH